MTEIQNIISVLFVVTGIYFMFAGSVGILRLPDFYSRSHSTSTSDTLGVIFVIMGLMIYEGATLVSLKLLFIAFFIALANPIGSHALARAAFKKGIKPMLKDNSKAKEDN